MCYLLNCYHHRITKESITKDSGPGPTLKNLDPENLDNKKRGKQLDVEKGLEDYTV